ncbi:putative acetyl-CoA acyltransferase [Neobacillus rhizosphaerae]|uniref:Acetyl-CoA acyltransferase n=1 Tax=Neobacillus rhizosphaerae TaxID=2880965 RepID=A0ABN8KLV6_9BACI|nr:thiolase family protein [Neobacillus rhizosphaerae]CAH2713835.1 putative acetyl-CoA acyltransferase [Neobacillus rhizosphaerae]
MNDVVICGIGMTQFGKFLNKGLKQLGSEAIIKALDDAGIPREAIQAAYVGNAVAGVVTGQESIRGQVVLRSVGMGGIPIFNIENACASSSSALHLASVAIKAGMYDCVLVLGVEKMTHEDRTVTIKAFEGGVDVEEIKDAIDASNRSHSIFMDVYAKKAREYMNRSGVTKNHLAMVASKNHTNGSKNPFAQRSKPITIEEVLLDRVVAEPFTRYMCSPISDGAAAVVLCSANYAKKLTNKPIYVAASVILSGKEHSIGEPNVIEETSRAAYQTASVGPEEIDVFEVHDAAASAELMAYEELGLCKFGEAGKLIEEKITHINGLKPVNPSGGLEAKGHPVGATGLGQICELVNQIRGTAGFTQVQNVKMALAQNAGGMFGLENAVAAVTILKK